MVIVIKMQKASNQSIIFIKQNRESTKGYKVNLKPKEWSSREKGRGLTQSYDKSPYTHRQIQNATWQHKNATKNFDYTTIADRLWMVSWGYDSHPTGVFKPVNGIPTFHLQCQNEIICLRRE